MGNIINKKVNKVINGINVDAKFQYMDKDAWIQKIHDVTNSNHVYIAKFNSDEKIAIFNNKIYGNKNLNNTTLDNYLNTKGTLSIDSTRYSPDQNLEDILNTTYYENIVNYITEYYKNRSEKYNIITPKVLLVERQKPYELIIGNILN